MRNGPWTGGEPSVYRTEEFYRKLAQGQHFLSSVVSGPKIYLIGDEDELADWLQFGWLKERKTTGKRSPTSSPSPIEI